MRRGLLATLVCGLSLACAQPASAMVDRGGTTIPNTGTTGTAAQLAGGPTVTKKLFTPESPGDDDPAVLATFGSSATPEDDLGAALDAVRGASRAPDAQGPRRRALDILEGNEAPARADRGLALVTRGAAEQGP